MPVLEVMMTSNRIKRLLFCLRVWMLKSWENYLPKRNFMGSCFFWNGCILQEQSRNETNQYNNGTQRVEENEIAKCINQHSGSNHGDNLSQENTQVEDTFHPAAC